MITSGELLQNHQGTGAALTRGCASSRREDRPQHGLHPRQAQAPVSCAGLPKRTHAGAGAASPSATSCCSPPWSTFPLAQAAPCAGLAPEVTRVTQCWGAHGSSPCWKHFFCVPAQTRHPPGSVGIAVTASRSGTSAGCASAHHDTLVGLGEWGGPSRAPADLHVALLQQRLNGNNFYLL